MPHGATFTVNKKNKGKFLFGTAVVSIVGSATTAGTQAFASNDATTFKDLGYNKLSSKVLEEYQKKMVKQFGLNNTEDLPEFDFEAFNNYTQNKIKKDNEERGKFKNFLLGSKDNSSINNEFLKDYLESSYKPTILKSVRDKARQEGIDKTRREYEQILINNGVSTSNIGNSGANKDANKSVFGNFISGISSAATNLKNNLTSFVKKRSPAQLAGIGIAAVLGGYFLFFNKSDYEKFIGTSKKNKENKDASKRKGTSKDEFNDDDLYGSEEDDDNENENDDEY